MGSAEGEPVGDRIPLGPPPNSPGGFVVSALGQLARQGLSREVMKTRASSDVQWHDALF
jgi:hypothetical protein